jgi:transposase
MRIAIEVGTHSPWVSRLLSSLGHEVIVANARKLRLIYQNRRKDDAIDALNLARLARMDPELLAPIRHRSEEAQVALAMLRSRDALVKARTKLINHVHGTVKATGSRLPKFSAEAFATKAQPVIPEPLMAVLRPALEVIAGLTKQIQGFEKGLEELASTAFVESLALRQVQGVGLLTSLAFVLVLEDAQRFRRSRTVGAFLGLVPATRTSGESNPQLHITKEGDEFLRSMLVNSAHYILGPFGQDCDLRRYGMKIAARGGRNAKKRAVVAVARKLAVLLHHLWRSRELYDRFHAATQMAQHTPAA